MAVKSFAAICGNLGAVSPSNFSKIGHISTILLNYDTYLPSA